MNGALTPDELAAVRDICEQLDLTYVGYSNTALIVRDAQGDETSIYNVNGRWLLAVWDVRSGEWRSSHRRNSLPEDARSWVRSSNDTLDKIIAEGPYVEPDLSPADAIRTAFAFHGRRGQVMVAGRQ